MACLERGHDITVFTQEWQGAIPPGFKVNVISTRSISNHGKCGEFARVAAAHLNEGRFDAVIGFNKMPGLDIYYAADPCYQNRMRKKYGGLYSLSPRHRTFMELERAVFSAHAKAEILLLCMSEREVFSHYYQTSSERFHLLPPSISSDCKAPVNAVDIRSDVRREFAIEDNENMVLMVGSSFKTKGLDRALLAMASLPTDLVDKTRLMVVGQDDPRPYLRRAKRLGVSGQLNLLGGREDVPRFLLGADLLLHPAYSEAAGMVLLEAMASGLPVLVTDVCGYAFHVAKAGAGQVIPSPFEQGELNRRLRYMLTSTEKHKWRTRGLSYAKNNDLHSMPARVVEVIEARALKSKTLAG